MNAEKARSELSSSLLHSAEVASRIYLHAARQQREQNLLTEDSFVDHPQQKSLSPLFFKILSLK